MKLYKYKSLDNLDHVYDILIENRLHCSPITQFNDPFEGYFIAKYLMGIKKEKKVVNNVENYYTIGIWKKFLRDDPQAINIVKAIQKKRVCALSNKIDNVLMWSHYADGHQGISIELDIPDEDIFFSLKGNYKHNKESIKQKVFKINYAKNLAEVIDGPDSKVVEEQAMSVLTTKISHWRYEGEFRIIQEEDSFKLSNKIKQVYCGYKIKNEILDQMKKLFPFIRFVEPKINDKNPWLKF